MGSARSVTINGLKIGGGAPVRVESMLKSRLTDLAACLHETERLAAAGCERQYIETVWGVGYRWAR